MKCITHIIFLLGCVLGFFGSPKLEAKEVDKGLVLIDNKPWKTSWIQEDKYYWVLKTHFDQGVLSTYFKSPPPKVGLGLSPDNKPVKQEFEFHFGKKFISTNSQFEQWPDGARAWGFTFEQAFERDNSLLEFGTTAIIQEVAGKEDEVRYVLFRRFNDDSYCCDKIDKPPLESPIHEQLAHKYLSRNLDILLVHQNYILCQNTALINLMNLLEENKNKDGYINEDLLKDLIKNANFPSLEMMKLEFEKKPAKNDLQPLISYGLKLISKNNNDAISDWFQLIAQETRHAIDSYVKFGMDFPQYRYILEEYERCNCMLEFSAQMLKLMNPKLFGSDNPN